MNKLFLEGIRFGRLLVQTEAGRSNNGKVLWNCLCDCGNTKIVVSNNLMQGGSTSCGVCVKTPDLAGTKVGNIIVKKFSRYYQCKDKKHRVAYWLCEDEEGHQKELTTAELTRGVRVHVIRKYTAEEAGHKTVFQKYKNDAKKKSREFMLPFEYFKKLITDNCFYCGVKPTNKTTLKRNRKESIKYSGIDRIDSKQGYTIENTVSCCINCNRAKSSMSFVNFVMLVDRIYNHMRRGDGL